MLSLVNRSIILLFGVNLDTNDAPYAWIETDDTM